MLVVYYDKYLNWAYVQNNKTEKVQCPKENLYSLKSTILLKHSVLLFKDYKASLSLSVCLSVSICLFSSIVFKALVVTALQNLLLWWCIYCFCVIIRFFPLCYLLEKVFLSLWSFLLAQYWCFFQDWCYLLKI